MSDDLTKELSVYFDELGKVGDKAIAAIKEQIDADAAIVETDLRTNTPERTGGLRTSLVKIKIDNDKRYGYRLEYAGDDPNGVPYARIANILDCGTSKIKPRRFIVSAVRKLKGLDDRAAKRWVGKIKE